MKTLRNLLAAIVLMAGLAPAFAQAPPPVPALPDTDRVQTYSISASTCACAVNFVLYGDTTDYQNWLTVWINGVQVQYNDTTFGWTITSPTGALGTIPRPITDAVLTFNSAQTGTITIVGARRPRRLSQFTEGRGVAARDLNQTVTDLVAQNREVWDLFERTQVYEPGFTPNPLPLASARAGLFSCYASVTGQPTTCAPPTGNAGTFAAGTGIAFSGTNPTTVSTNLAGGTGIQIAGATISTAPGVDTNTLNGQTANYTIATSDCGKTVQMSAGQFTVTLPATTGFATTCQVTICNVNPNTNTQHAMRLSGFPNPIFARLYMQQCVGVKNVGGTWAASYVPGRFRPTFQPVLFVDNGGSNANDGLISNASTNALLTMQQCLSILQNEYDLVGFQPTCSPTGGQTIVGSFAQVGMNLASSVFNIAGNGGLADLRPTPGANALLQMEDYSGYVITTNVNIDCTGGSASCIGVSFHQEGGADFNSGTKFTGNGPGSQAINCDGRCKVNFNSDASSAVIFSGSYLNAVFASQGASLVAFNGLTLDNNASVASDYLSFQQGARFQFRGALNGGTGTSVGGSVIRLQSQATACLTNFTKSWVVQPTQQFTVLNYANLYNVSANPLPGTAAGINSSTGFANGAAPDNAGTNTGVNAGGC